VSKSIERGFIFIGFSYQCRYFALAKLNIDRVFAAHHYGIK
jgi:hypothetical protein